MPNLPKTDQRLIDRLELAAKHEMSAEEVRRQRVSFAFGNLPQGNTMTKQQVAGVIARLEGE
jgi:hypothetical protein